MTALASVCIAQCVVFLSLLQELNQYKNDRAEVARIEQFIEKQAPYHHPATRRGFAEWTVEHRWPVPHD